MTKFVLLFTILSALFVSNAHSQTHDPIRYFKGLSGIEFDQLTQVLANNPTTSVSYTTGRMHFSLETFDLILNRTTSRQAAFELIYRSLQDYTFSDIEDYKLLAQDVLELRDKFRASTRELTYKRDIMFLLQMIAEEALHVGAQKHRNFPKQFVFNPKVQPTIQRYFNLNGVQYQTGDVFLFKSIGAGSSSLISMGMQNPHIFSHSTPAYVTPDRSELLSPEAHIEDGVKIRDLEKSYQDRVGKVRTFVYRSSDESQIRAIQNSTDIFISNMHEITATPRLNSAYPYNFSMIPSRIGDSFFCTGVSQHIYEKAGIPQSQTPYNIQEWSNVTNGAKHLFQILGIGSPRIPAPGDIESNPHFKLVVAKIHTNNLLQERVENAILDNFLDILDKDSGRFAKLKTSLSAIGNRSLNKDVLQEFLNLGIINERIYAQIEMGARNIPNNINLKQLLFFYILNEVVTPKVREKVTTEIRRIQRETGRIVGPQETREITRNLARDISQKATDVINAKIDLFTARNQPKSCQALF